MKCFEILGLEASATTEAVKTAYRRLAGEVHPDHGGEAAAFHRLHLAYQQALAETEKPLICQACQGFGTVKVTKGWSSVCVACKACRGAGSIDRG